MNFSRPVQVHLVLAGIYAETAPGFRLSGSGRHLGRSGEETFPPGPSPAP